MIEDADLPMPAMHVMEPVPAGMLQEVHAIGQRGVIILSLIRGVVQIAT